MLAALIIIVTTIGADAVSDLSMYVLLGTAAIATVLALTVCRVDGRIFLAGMRKGIRQMLPCFPLLLLIATVSTTWMLSGVVPFLVESGIALLNPATFLVVTCVCCALVSTLTGSSWTTIATVGVAFLGMGTVFGYNPAWTAGAIISGAYFGDKFSPLSDTTVIAAATAQVEIFSLIRYMLITTIPAFGITCIIFAFMGLGHTPVMADTATDIVGSLSATFNITPWVLLVPGVTAILIACRVHTLMTLVGSTLAGIAGIFIFQHGIIESLGVHNWWDSIKACGSVLLQGADINTGSEAADNLVATSGMYGMIPTVLLVASAALFGGAMMGSGFLERITRSIASKLTRRHSVVGATVATGVTMNALTADQYVSIIIGTNVYKDVYRSNGLSNRLLGRTIQDSVPVTSVLIPWNSCGVTQSAVLGVSTVLYFPFCFFNILSPLSSVAVASFSHYRERRRARKLSPHAASMPA